ncbi:MAG: sugar transferase [Anaerolineaceae bacterium]
MDTPQTKALPYFKPKTAFSLRNALNRFFRRALDLLTSFFVLLFISPVFAFIAWRIRQDSPGPVFYRCLRAGRFGRSFQILKFRTMFEDPLSYAGSQVTAEDDERITPLGKFLRDSKINELPQFWNVFRGQMRFVGPRLEAVEIAALWPEDQRNIVLSVRLLVPRGYEEYKGQGITSPA